MNHAHAFERAALEAQRDQITEALKLCTFPPFVAHAKRLRGRAEHVLATNTDMGLTSYAGMIPQWQHAVDDVCGALRGYENAQRIVAELDRRAA